MKKNNISEATGSGNSGHYKTPIVLAPQIWDEEQLGPFTDSVYHYSNAELAYEEADGDFKESPQKRKEIEIKTKKISKILMKQKQSYQGQNDEEGSAVNPTMSGLPLKEELLKEDLAVWFGTKKKPKGSKQPKGPWVNICRKVDGKHPPCGRPDADSKGYPKCRAAGVAGKMSDSEKKSACSQKRREEKKNPKTGKGNKPTMTSYKPRKESIRELIKNILQEEITENSNNNLILRRRLSTIENLIDKNIKEVEEEQTLFNDEFEFADNIISWVVQDLMNQGDSLNDYDELTDLVKDNFGDYILSQYNELDFSDFYDDDDDEF